jgi:exosortase A
MQPLVEERAGAVAAPRSIGQRGLVLGALAAGLAVLLAAFWPEAVAAVATWNASTAYGHCYLVLPMALYLLWERRTTIASVPPRTELAWALLALPLAAAWLAAERLGIMEGRQLTALAGLELLLLTVLGRRLFWALSGPLLFLFFLVPFGAFLTPTLQHFTARFSAVGLDVLGIPNYVDDLAIEIPEGNFYVAEACAGLRFLIAAIAFGVFYALLNYRSPARRAAFIAASIIVPIIANGFRALGIVVLGHILGSAEAAAADHIVYGWIFFSVVMLLLVAAGMPLREVSPARPPISGPILLRPGPNPLAGAFAVAALMLIGPAIASAFNARAAAAPLAALPSLNMPTGCERAGPEPHMPATRADFQLRCGGLVLNATIQTFPARSTPSALVAERRRATADLGAENTTVADIPGLDQGQGHWTLVVTEDPWGTTALATWVRGEPARGGLSGRLEQARDSIFGAGHSVVLIAIGASQPSRLAPGQQRQLQTVISNFVQAQAGLTEQIASLSRQP